jgi:Uma2 family endonuclease
MLATPTLEKLIPERRKMSYEAYLDLADGPKIMEWVNGEVIIHVPPIYEHQDIISFLDNLLRLFVTYFDLGRLIIAPFEVKLWPDGPSREPDILFIGAEKLAQLTSKRFEGGPDLVIEIISPGSLTIDRIDKFTEYQQAGVREYWLIDPRPHQQQADFYVLGDDGAFYPASVDDNGLYHSTVLPHFWLNVEWLRQEKLPNPQWALAEIMVSMEGLPPEVKAAYQAMHKALADKK